ncbi:2-oxo acid dehydrogenase subunit E2 [Mesonia aquimarina]|uniref:2-oxo acid dehydrogenase subunit E2 n=1 Tax=Mesonia aquimarina TaxID=1504967 RepID=UPI000EF5F116|nr:2-oxo acid dehydrogenase subunit E2 [Mesonia aquimarina]
MAKEIKIPQISEGVDTATISEILVAKGDKIEEEQAVVSVETDKATAEVPATSGGTVKEIKVSEGDEVKVGDVVLILEEGDEEEDSAEDKQEEAASEEEEQQENKDENEVEDSAEDTKEESDTEEEQQQEDEDEDSEEDVNKKTQEKKEQENSSDEEDKTVEKDNSSEEKNDSSEVHASPGVRRLARELKVDLQQIKGSGESGRITEKDVKNHHKNGDKKSGSSLSKLPDFSKWGTVETKKLNSIKKTTAKNVTTSWQSIPHVFQFGEADISGIEAYIEKHQDKVEEAGGKLTLTSILTKIVATALHQFPIFNASIDVEKEKMILKKYVNISIAVATEKGLLVPVIKNADQKSIKDLSVEIAEIAQKARDGELSKEDMEGGNFSISNLGGIGGTNFTPIVYYPQVAILGVSRVSTKPVFVEDKFEPKSILPLSLSYDHRLIDGADGAAFINWIEKALEDPYEALLS